MKFLNEQAAPRRKYMSDAEDIADVLLWHCSYLILYADGHDDYHWKNEIYGFVSRFKIKELKDGAKLPILKTAWVREMWGEHFEEGRMYASEVLSNVYDSEDEPHEFSFNMSSRSNIDVYFDALDRFYYEFLCPWTAKTSKNPSKQELFDAIDQYLIGARKMMR